eukprot:gene1296-1431_t
MPGKITAIQNFKGDNFVSFNTWVLQFEAQLNALEVKNEGKKWRDILLCCAESSAFATVSNATIENGNIKYEDLKKELTEMYWRPEYKRTLEAKLRTLKFVPGHNIAAYCHEIKSVIKELYGITDNGVIESIAQNHTLPKLVPEVQEPAKLLQLTGKCSLESILELANSAAGSNALHRQEGLLAAGSGTSSPPDDRMDKQEAMIERLTTQVERMTEKQGRKPESHDEEIRLKKGETLGTLNCPETVNETDDPVEVCAASPEKSDEKLHHLDQNQRNQVVKALKDYVQQLAKKPEVSLIQHEIRVNDSTQMLQAPRRMPYSQRAELTNKFKSC